MKLLTIVGTRPNFIKLAPLDRELRKHHTCITVHTGQHYDDNMSDTFFRELGIAKPNYNLHVSNINDTETHATQTAHMMIQLDRVMIKQRPDLVIVYGDTNSTLAGALVAAKRNIPVAHVEAGCRSFDWSMPEEVNRVIVDGISTLLFCPTESALSIAFAYDGRIKEYTGDVTADVLAENMLRAREQEFEYSLPAKFALMTLHRPSNVDNPGRLKQILDAVERSGITTIFPVHPRTRKAIHGECQYKNIIFRDPAPYWEMLHFLDNASVVITDSGGVQKEAYILKKPCLTIRNNTEWPETLSHGWNRLIVDISRLPAEIVGAAPKAGYTDYFPTGASRKIAKIISEWGCGCR